MQATQRISLALAVATAIAAPAALAQTAPVIRITNANNHEIPLLAGSSVKFDINGNLLAECALTNGLCTQLSSGTGGGGTGSPTVSLARNDGDAEVRAGEFVRLTWSTTNALVCNAASTGPAATAFSGPRGITQSTGESVTVSAEGAYTFSLQCFNTAGGSTVQSVAATVLAASGGGGGGGGAGCSITSTDPLFQPAGYGSSSKTFVQAFSAPDGSPAAVYPNSVGFPVPVGANKGSYTAIEFTASANVTVDMTWDTAQANGLQGYPNPRPADSMFIGISPCPGDLRAANASGGDPWLSDVCRQVSGAGSMFYSTKAGVSPTSVCILEAGQKYYINLAPINPAVGLTPYTCNDAAANSASGCDVQMRHTGS